MIKMTLLIRNSLKIHNKDQKGHNEVNITAITFFKSGGEKTKGKIAE